MRINEQQSYYQPEGVQGGNIEKNTIKFETGQSRNMGPIGKWESPSYFISGNRGIMCESNMGLDNISARRSGTKLPSLGRMVTPEKENGV